MFFNYGYAVLGAESNGACGRALGHCQYRVSFVKASVFEAKEAPPFGMGMSIFMFSSRERRTSVHIVMPPISGSPEEEHFRLLNYLSAVDGFERCSNHKPPPDEMPMVCETHLTAGDCMVFYVRYRLLKDPSLVTDTFGRCSVHLAYPEPTDLRLVRCLGQIMKLEVEVNAPIGRGQGLSHPS